MRIGAADPQRRDAGASWTTVRLPVGERPVDIKRRILEINLRIRSLEVKTAGQLSMPECQHRLDESGDAGRCIEMSNVRFQRSDGAVAVAIRRLAEGLRQTLELDRIANQRPRAMSLHVTDTVRLGTGNSQRLGDHFRLTGNAGREISHFTLAIIIHGRAQDHGVDRIVVFHRIFETPQDDDADAAGKDRSVRGSVEGPTGSPSRERISPSR